ncbi:MAG TPA: AbrB family transcriptional regulator [Steroidobacteraceae bacterium]|nr:AbrB family transcriptional regulator [Steroidobacteraceae bacterium]
MSVPGTPAATGSSPQSIAQWLALLAASAAVGAMFAWLRVPAALLLGPMLAGITIAAGGGSARVPNWAFLLAQGFIGCMIANMTPLAIASEILSRWPVFVFGVLAVIAVSTLLGWWMTRMHILPGTAVLWGSSPGAATAMIVMAEAHGADARLVAFMQYLRVAVVAAGASIVARLWNLGPSHAVASIVWFPTLSWLPFLETLALATLGPLVAHLLNIRSGALLIPLGLGLLLSHMGWLTIELPPWLLLLSYAVIGWSIGLRFTRSLLAHAAKAFPRVLACMVALIFLCAVLAAVLVVTAGVDPLTAYLATSPGGADSVAIIAASSKVDVPFVMAMQTTRLVAVILLAPVITRYIAALPRSRYS